MITFNSPLDKNWFTCPITSFKYLLDDSFDGVGICLAYRMRSFVGVNCLQHALCVNTSVTRCEYVPIRSATSSLMPKVTAAFTPDSGFEKGIPSNLVSRNSQASSFLDISELATLLL